MADGGCANSKAETPVVLDHEARRVICSECALVLQSGFVDEMNVSHAAGPLVAKNEDCMARRLGVGGSTENRALELYKKVKDRKVCWRSKSNAIMAACLFCACQEEGSPRTLKEISVVANGGRIKEIARAKMLVEENLERDTKFVRDGDLVTRYCSILGLDCQATKAVQETVKKCEELGIRKTPRVILAAVIFLITQLSDGQTVLQDIAHVAETSEWTIKETCRELYPYASMLIPDRYANEGLKKLRAP